MNTAPQAAETAGSIGKTVPVAAPGLPQKGAAVEQPAAGPSWSPNGFPASVSVFSPAAGAAPVQAADPTRQVDRIAAAERIKAVVSHEVSVLKSSGAGSLAVMLRPDPETELFVQITRNGDQVEAFVRIDKGNSAELHQGWERLQSSLAGQQVRLLPLQSSDFNDTSPRQSPQHDGHEFDQPRGEFRDGPGFGREQRGGREPREPRAPFEPTNARPGNRPEPARQAGFGRGRAFESWA